MLQLFIHRSLTLTQLLKITSTDATLASAERLPSFISPSIHHLAHLCSLHEACISISFSRCTPADWPDSNRWLPGNREERRGAISETRPPSQLHPDFSEKAREAGDRVKIIICCSLIRFNVKTHKQEVKHTDGFLFSSSSLFY